LDPAPDRLAPNPVKLACGIGIGSTANEVKALFGGRSGADNGQYRLEFYYEGEKVWKIRISQNPDAFPYGMVSPFKPYDQ
jgi:hypothetical protein